MLNLFAATGHVHYTKSARFYLQQMLDLPISHPEVHNKFVQLGYHVIRRSDRHWSGLWSDLVIEQVMMRSIKSVGGLTRGRGVTESVRDQWTLTAHHLASIHDGMTDLTKSQIMTSEQHSEMSNARIIRDQSDGQKMYVWLIDHNPLLNKEENLKSISTGVISNGEVNCHRAEEIGAPIQIKLDDMPLGEAKIKRNDRVKCLDSKVN